MPVTHTKVSALADGTDATLVRPSDWNAAHTGSNAHGAADHTDITRYIWLPANAFSLRAGTSTLAMRGSNTKYQAWNFPDATVANEIFAMFMIPPDWQSLYARLAIANLGGATGVPRFSCVFRSEGDVFSNAGEPDINGTAAQGDAGTQTTTAFEPSGNVANNATWTIGRPPGQGNSYDLTISQGSISSAGGWLVSLIIRREGTHANDNLTNDAGFIGARIDYMASQ